MRLCDELTAPEDCAERKARRRVLEIINASGGCAVCLNRDKRVQGWCRSICRSNPYRTWPKCSKDGRAPAFEMDKDKLLLEIMEAKARVNASL